MKLSGKICKIRTVKNYPQAHNHLLVGRIEESDTAAVMIYGKTYHYKRNIVSIRDVKVGSLGLRVLPWARIEIMNIIPPEFDYENAELGLSGDGEVTLKSAGGEISVFSSKDSSL
ncbi:hypothetical protein SMSP2_02720 [Limihaloglobus sulfuriphilus]|uniref:Uncharacterized protein n=1 Tax=Limihaloglobus sulfuriphilus TaxID=1851148 RepID=A0A1Q2MIY9_9BACT|nr:hypothetical protein [Limihaloglobus sulfuriphilus]AQQ72337.1 hypothetical protein SMSP2_02720 [Limihaloglobus sulfuriphilus]